MYDVVNMKTVIQMDISYMNMKTVIQMDISYIEQQDIW